MEQFTDGQGKPGKGNDQLAQQNDSVPADGKQESYKLMPWTANQFRSRHNKGLSTQQSGKAASIANAMLKRGVPEGEAIATANARAEGKPRQNYNGPGRKGFSSKQRSGKGRNYTGA